MRFVLAEVTMIPSEEGGRRVPVQLSRERYFMPHLVVGDPSQREAIMDGNVITEEYLGVAFPEEDLMLEPGRRYTLRLGLFWEEAGADYSTLVPEATFTIREGPKIVGYGRVVEHS